MPICHAKNRGVGVCLTAPESLVGSNPRIATRTPYARAVRPCSHLAPFPQVRHHFACDPSPRVSSVSSSGDWAGYWPGIGRVLDPDLRFWAGDRP